MDRAGEARRGWMSERLKESVLKTEVFLEIPGVRIPLHPREHNITCCYECNSRRIDHYSKYSKAENCCSVERRSAEVVPIIEVRVWD